MTSYGAIALSSAQTRPAEIAGVVSRVLDGRALELAVGDEDVQFSVAHDHHDAQGWLRLVDTWHATLKRELGDLSVGHAAPRTGPSATRRTRFEAAEALRLGERAFGGGHLTGYGMPSSRRFCCDTPTSTISARSMNAHSASCSTRTANAAATCSRPCTRTATRAAR